MLEACACGVSVFDFEVVKQAERRSYYLAHRVLEVICALRCRYFHSSQQTILKEEYYV